MKLKNFYETFRDDLMDQEFVIGYLEDALEEGGVSLFISALEDVVIVNQKHLDSQLFKDFLNNSNPEMSLVFKVLNLLGLTINLKVKC
ncbi:putative transcriptional regulator [Cyanobacterium stanieri PCC 7202]|uniref:Transcriptional regulator n=1 Tax=Cyanobacterium stanieri (strain ATCC 29140 / PCC 7202) TaxID=292563 RepID=K9YNJ1_CYASC|nr:putative transcriptional regulator [Cyanobacterium stanieri PCC 7202]